MKKTDVIFSWVMPIVILIGFTSGIMIAKSVIKEGFWYHYGKEVVVGIILGVVLIMFVSAIINTIKYAKQDKAEKRKRL